MANSQCGEFVPFPTLIGPQVGVNLAVVRQVAEREGGHGAAEGHVVLGELDGGGEDPLGDGVVEGRAEEVAQQRHPPPRQLPPLAGAQKGGVGVGLGEVVESVAGSEKSLIRT